MPFHCIWGQCNHLLDYLALDTIKLPDIVRRHGKAGLTELNRSYSLNVDFHQYVYLDIPIVIMFHHLLVEHLICRLDILLLLESQQLILCLQKEQHLTSSIISMWIIKCRSKRGPYPPFTVLFIRNARRGRGHTGKPMIIFFRCDSNVPSP